MNMNIKIDDLVFDRANYDAEGDVLYLARGNTSVASEAALTPEGHGVRYDANGEVIGVTLINARRIIGRDGHITITLPHAVQVEAKEQAATPRISVLKRAFMVHRVTVRLGDAPIRSETLAA